MSGCPSAVRGVGMAAALRKSSSVQASPYRITLGAGGPNVALEGVLLLTEGAELHEHQDITANGTTVITKQLRKRSFICPSRSAALKFKICDLWRRDLLKAV